MNRSDFTRIEQAIRYLEQHVAERPSLDRVAAQVGLSPYHFQRLFKRWAGVSPKQFLQYLTAARARELLRASASVLDAALEVGLSGPGRLHDLLISTDAVTPGEYKSAGKGLELRYGYHDTPFGECLAAITSRGLCSLGFIGAGGHAEALAALRGDWPAATLLEDPQASRPAIAQIFAPAHDCPKAPLRLFLRGTNFQLKVWEALLRIPEGTVVSYSALAEAVDRPGAGRAVGNAVGHNPIAYLIPCHRVLRASGKIGGYRWGDARKQVILTTELVRQRGRQI
jgi:AraC family transcriptional regulator of adaptative response/methylated-DNA-[protein]-cysteine methyltransferase